MNATQYELTPIKITKFKLNESNANTKKETNYTTTHSRKTNAAKKENLPAGKNKSSTQLSNRHSKKSTYSYQNNPTTSNTPTTNTSEIETTAREQEIDNSTRRQQNKTQEQTNTKTKETPCTLKRKLLTQKVNRNTKKTKICDIKRFIKPEHKLKKLEIKIPNILTSLHQQHNTKVLRKAKEDNMLCKQYGFNFKIPFIHIEHIAQKK